MCGLAHVNCSVADDNESIAVAASVFEALLDDTSALQNPACVSQKRDPPIKMGQKRKIQLRNYYRMSSFLSWI